MGQVRASYPRFRREGESPGMALTPDDIAILRHVYRHRFVRADDLYRLFPERSESRISRRLTALYRNEYLDRPIAQVDRFREGGSSSLVYGLDARGARYLKEHENVAIGVADWKARNRSYTRQNLDHTLAVASFLIDLELACRARPDVDLIPFEEILIQAPEKTRRLAQPGGWPVPLSLGGPPVTVQVVPDAIFGLRVTGPDGRKARTFVFLEIDRGTMTIAPAKHVRESDGFLHRSSVLRKFLAYTASHELGLHREHFGIPAARVLTLTTGTRRAEAMRRSVSELVKSIRPLTGLFLFGVQNGESNPMEGTWIDAAGRAVTFRPR